MHQGLDETWADWDFLERLRQKIKILPVGWQIEVSCFNINEVQWFQAHLTEDEQKKIARWKWHTFRELA